MLLVLLAICSNVTLMLARHGAREGEIRLRVALGASPARVVRLILAEALVLATAGAVVGVVIAVWGAGALRVIPLTALPLRLDAAIDGSGLLVALLLGLLAGLLIGVAPALHLARTRPQESATTGQAASGRSRVRDALMAMQVALAMVNEEFVRRFLGGGEVIGRRIVARARAHTIVGVVRNTIANAFGEAPTAVGSSAASGTVAIDVEDDGPGLADEMLDAVRQRGVRADEAAPGTGFGLAIVRDVAELHGGNIKLTRSSMGGLQARLSLPANH
jgi:hypothetical protein